MGRDLRLDLHAALAVMLLLMDLLGFLAAAFLLALLGQHLRLAWRARSYRRPPQVWTNAPKGGQPAILLQIPLYNEASSIEGALGSALSLDWPSEKLTIQLLDDSTDGTSAMAAAAIARLPRSGPLVQHLRRAGRQGFKAGALAEGLLGSDAPFIAILDADFRAPRDWLRQAMAALAADEQAAFAQFRFEFANGDQNWMTRGQQLSVDAHFLAEQAGRQASGEIFQFNGTGAVWRRTAIQSAGGWSPDTLAEDLDLTFRAYAAGWHGVLLLDPPLACEAPADLASWRVQQARWSAGFVQVARRALPLVWRSGWRLSAKLGASLLLGMQLGLPCFLFALAAFVVDGLSRGFGPVHGIILCYATLFALGSSVAITAPPFRRLQRGGIIRYGSVLTMIPALLVFMALANSAGVLATPFRRRHDFKRTPKTGGK